MQHGSSILVAVVAAKELLDLDGGAHIKARHFKRMDGK